MNKVPKLSTVFFGWWTVLACGIIGFFGVGFVNLGFSALFKPIASELGLSRAVTSIAASVQSVAQGVCAPAGGWVSDRYGPRLLMLIGIFCLALGCMMMYFIDAMWSLLVVWGLVVGAGFSLGCTVITDKAIVNWFVKRSGTALNTKFAIQSLSGLLLLPVVAWLLKIQGWRMTCVIAGVVIALVCFPLIWFFVKSHRPEYYGFIPDGKARNKRTMAENTAVGMETNHVDGVEAEFTFRQTIKTPTYWLMISLGYTSGLVVPLMGIHCIPLLTDREIDPIMAASMMGLMTTVSIPARLGTGFVVDHLKTGQLRFVLMTGYILQTIGVAISLISNNIAVIYIWFLFYGIGAGVTQSAQLPLWARYFGRMAFGSILGSSMAMHVPVGLAAPIFVGWVYDTTGSYMKILILSTLLLAASGVLACFVLPPKRPGSITPILGT